MPARTDLKALAEAVGSFVIATSQAGPSRSHLASGQIGGYERRPVACCMQARAQLHVLTLLVLVKQLETSWAFCLETDCCIWPAARHGKEGGGANHEVGASQHAAAATKKVGQHAERELLVGKVERVWLNDIVEPLQHN